MRKKSKIHPFDVQDLDKARERLQALATEEVPKPIAFSGAALIESLREEIDVLYGRGLRNSQILDELKKIGVNIARTALIRDKTLRNKASAKQTPVALAPTVLPRPMARATPTSAQRSAVITPGYAREKGAMGARSKDDQTSTSAPVPRRISGFVPIPDTPDI
jgi:hypothetical protein